MKRFMRRLGIFFRLKVEEFKEWIKEIPILLLLPFIFYIICWVLGLVTGIMDDCFGWDWMYTAGLVYPEEFKINDPFFPPEMFSINPIGIFHWLISLPFVGFMMIVGFGSYLMVILLVILIFYLIYSILKMLVILIRDNWKKAGKILEEEEKKTEIDKWIDEVGKEI